MPLSWVHYMELKLCSTQNTFCCTKNAIFTFYQKLFIRISLCLSKKLGISALCSPKIASTITDE